MKSRTYRIFHVVAALIICSSGLLQAATYYVSPEGDNTTGQTWTSALTDIQAALDRASSVAADTILVRQGTYAIAAPIRVTKPVILKGGYSGDGDARNPVVFISALRGNGAVAHCLEVSVDATIDGFWISGGSAFGDAPNDQGGGMYITQCSPIIYGCTFESNYASSHGGAIAGRFFNGSISDCSFVQNAAGLNGGAIHLFSSHPSITDCAFTGNRGNRGVTTRGGAICNEDSSPTISRCVFSGNAASEGASLYNGNSDAAILDCEFAGCDLGAGRGGGVYSFQSSATIRNCLFYGNHVDVSGAAIFEADSSGSSVVNCIIRNNGAVAQGGAIFIDNNASTRFTNCTIYANSVGGRGGAVFNNFGKPIFTNCILWENTASMADPGICNESGSANLAAVVRYSDVQGTGVYPGTGNILADPMFVYPAGDDLRLVTGSPCIDAGVNSASDIPVQDFEYNPRIVDGDLDGTAVVDMGAYEHQRGLQIKDHLQWVYISQGQSYDSPSAGTAGYMFVLQAQTDNTVDHIEFLSPAGYAYGIPNAPSTSSGNVQTRHQENGPTHMWQYWARLNDSTSLATYGDGGYLIVLYYNNGNQQQTNVSYTFPGTSQPVPAPQQKPVVTSPAHQAAAASPVTFEWQACTDPKVTTIALAIIDADTGAVVDSAGANPSETNSEPFSLEEGQYRLELGFENSYSVLNADGVPFLYGKAIIVRSAFEVLYATMHRFWSPVLSRHFYTISEAERDHLISVYGHVWTYEGPAFRACATAYHPGLSPVHRFWSPVNSAHFYTISTEEKDYLIATYPHIWTYEGIAFYAYPNGSQPAGTVPVHRFWSPVNSAHFFTVSEEEKSILINTWGHIFTYEGVAFYTYP